MNADGNGRPVVRHSRRAIFENGVMAVCLDHVEARNGVSVEQYVVVVPQGGAAPRIAGVTVLPIWNGRVVLQRMYRHPLDAWFWEAPRGMVDDGEGPEEAARRELAEETGLSCPPGRLLALGTYTPDNATLVARGALFAALDCRAERPRGDDEIGLGEQRAFTLGEVLELAGTSGIEDSSTLIALYRFARTATVGREAAVFA